MACVRREACAVWGFIDDEGVELFCSVKVWKELLREEADYWLVHLGGAARKYVLSAGCGLMGLNGPARGTDLKILVSTVRFRPCPPFCSNKLFALLTAS